MTASPPVAARVLLAGTAPFPDRARAGALARTLARCGLELVPSTVADLPAALGGAGVIAVHVAEPALVETVAAAGFARGVRVVLGVPSTGARLAAARLARCLVEDAAARTRLRHQGVPEALLAVTPALALGGDVDELAAALVAAWRGEPHPGDAPAPSARWVGDFGVATSLATINDAVTDVLERRRLVVVDRRPRGTRPRLQDPLVDVEVRHQWPPSFEAPPTGRLALVQPWEFGSLPLDWQAPLRERVDEVWIPSEHVRRMYLAAGMAPDRVHVVPNGVDLEVFRPDGDRLELDAPGVRILFVGGTLARKGIDVLADAYIAAFAARDDVSLVVKDVGASTFYQGINAAGQLREAAEARSIPRVAYLDADLSRAELAALYRACDVLVHPYRGEGFAMPVLEAMACGLPVVVTAGGPTDEFCPDDACWRVRSTRRPVSSSTIGGMQTVDAPWMLEPDRDDLVRVLQAVVADAPGRRERGRAGARAARAFSWTAIAELYAERVRRLAARPTLADARADPMPLPDDPALALLATPAWQGDDALPALLAAWAAAADPASGACLCLLADPDVDGRADAWEERILGAADAAGVDLERVADIAVLDASGDAETARRLHARCAGYVSLHDGCAGHVALAREAGSALLPPSADALRAFIDATLPGAARVP